MPRAIHSGNAPYAAKAAPTDGGHPTDAPQARETFLDSPPSLALEDSRVVILPVPYEGADSYRPGARHAPRAIISASRQLEEWDAELRTDVTEVGIYTAPELELSAGSPEAMIERVHRAASRYAAQGRVVGILGGEHTATIGGVAAALERRPDLTVLYLDAHADLRDEYLGNRWSHACAARRLSEMAPVVEVGVRSMSRAEADYIASHHAPVFTWPPRKSIGELASEVIERLGPDVYVSVDVDIFDPSIMPAVGYPEPGGASWHEVTELLRRVGEARRIVAFDVVELIPDQGPASCVFTAAKLAQRLIALATRAGQDGG